MKQINWGENNAMWKGNRIYKMTSIHRRMERRVSKPDFCQECKTKPPMDLANISQEYKLEVSDWEWLCRKCHMTKDGRIKNMHKNNPRHNVKKLSINCIVCGKRKEVVPSRSNAKCCGWDCYLTSRFKNKN